MNPFSSEYDEQQQRLDLLVDGELPEHERRQLLASLDEQPDGWRRCALAFLEAQCWADDLQAIAHPAPAASAAAKPQPEAPVLRPASKMSPQGWWHGPSPATLAALAAGVMLCFALGMSAARWLDRPGARFGAAGRSSDGLPLAAVDGPLKRQSDAAVSPLDHLTLVLAEGRDDVVPVQVPIVKDPASAAQWLNASPPLPADVRQALERLGGRVREHRQLIPVRMGDGRDVVVPVDRIDLQPVNLKDYQ